MAILNTLFANQGVSSSGGTISGDLTVEGDFVVEGGGSLTVDAAITGDTTFTSSTDAKPYISIEQTGNNVNGGSIEFLTSSTATADDISGTIRFKGMNDAGTPAEIEFATIYAKHTNITASGNAEAGELVSRSN